MRVRPLVMAIFLFAVPALASYVISVFWSPLLLSLPVVALIMLLLFEGVHIHTLTTVLAACFVGELFWAMEPGTLCLALLMSLGILLAVRRVIQIRDFANVARPSLKHFIGLFIAGFAWMSVFAIILSVIHVPTFNLLGGLRQVLKYHLDIQILSGYALSVLIVSLLFLAERMLYLRKKYSIFA